MPIYVVTRNDVPWHATFSKQEARQLFDSTVHSGQYQQVAVMMVPMSSEAYVLVEAAQLPEGV